MADRATDAITKWLATAPQEVRDAILAQGSTVAASAHPARKQAKAEANYRPADGDQRCGTCANYDGEGACAVVAGGIDPDHVSDLYTPSTEATNEPDGTAEPAEPAADNVESDGESGG